MGGMRQGHGLSDDSEAGDHPVDCVLESTRNGSHVLGAGDDDSLGIGNKRQKFRYFYWGPLPFQVGGKDGQGFEAMEYRQLDALGGRVF